MSEAMIDRVARAIYDATPFKETSGGYDEQSETYHRMCRALAKAAIAAMREPTPNMLETAWQATTKVDPMERMTVMLMAARPAHDVKMRNRYGAMIDAALMEPQP